MNKQHLLINIYLYIYIFNYYYYYYNKSSTGDDGAKK